MPLQSQKPSFLRRILRGVYALFRNNIDWIVAKYNIFSGRIVLNAASFDRDFYLEHNPDVAERKVEPFRHFMRHGLYENRQARFFDTAWYLGRYPDLLTGHLDAYRHFRELGAREGRSGQYLTLHATPVRPSHTNYREWVEHFDTLRKADIRFLRAEMDALPACKVCVIIAGDVGRRPDLKRTLASLDRQVLPPSEIRFITANNGEWDEELPATVILQTGPGNFIERLNRAIAESVCDYVLFADCGAEFNPAALYWIAATVSSHSCAEIIYSDEDQLDDDGRRSNPRFKPDFNEELMLTGNWIGNLFACRKDLLILIGGADASRHAWDYDLALRAAESAASGAIVHIPRVLYHGRGVLRGDMEDRIQVVKSHVGRRNRSACVTPAEEAPDFTRVRFALPSSPRVSIIIPTRDRLDILRVCLNSLLDRTTYAPVEIIVVDNGSREAATLAYLAVLEAEKKIRILRDPSPFNFSALNNAAVKIASGDYVCLMNNDIEIITPDWLEEMLSFAQLPDVGCVGARLWYPDNRLQHAGVLIGFHGVAGHMHKFLQRGNAGRDHRAALHQSLSAVTAACLLVRKALYTEVGGLDESFAVAFNDVDFCLKVREAGYRNVYTPYAEMYHHESASRGQSVTKESADRELAEINMMKTRWGSHLNEDFAYNPNLTLLREDFSFAWPPRIATVGQIRLARRKRLRQFLLRGKKA